MTRQEYKKAYNAKYYAEHIDRLREEGSKRGKAWYEKNKERKRMLRQIRIHTPKGKEMVAKCDRVRNSTPEGKLKGRCRKMARYYLNTGKIARGACEVCGGAKVQIHHEDYNRPLDIKWLCQKHHAELHYALRYNNPGPTKGEEQKEGKA